MPGGSPWPRISIVTPSYNQGQFIEETIRSILLQGYPDLEYIIIDGGSNDNSIEVIRKYERWLKYWISEPDKGQAAAINKGFGFATGRINAYLNSDDLYENGIMREVATRALTKSQSDHYWIVTQVVNFGGHKESLVLPPENISLYYWVTNQANIHQPGTFWSYTLYNRVGGFDERYDFTFDRKFFMELISRGIVPELLSVVGARFRVHENSKTTLAFNESKDGTAFVDEFIQLSREYRNLLTPREQLEEVRFYRQKAMSHARGRVNSMARLPAITNFVFESIRSYPSSVGTRFFWGSIKELVRGNTS